MQIDDLPENDDDAFAIYASNKIEEIVKYDRDGDPIVGTAEQLRLLLTGALRVFSVSPFLSVELENSGEITSYVEGSSFIQKVKTIIELYELKRARETKGNVFESVIIADEYKTEIRKLIHRIKERIDIAGLSLEKSESLHNKLNVFLGELDRERTRLAAITAAFIQVSSSVGKSAEKLEPAVGLFERVMKAIGVGSSPMRGLPKSEDELRQLPPPEELSDPEK